MSSDDIAAGGVVAVMLADGWHRIVPGSFWVGPMSFGAGADLTISGFRFEEADAGRPYPPAVLAGPLHSVIAVRQVASAARRTRDQDRERGAHNGQRASHGTRLRVSA
jgi:hypothetical protein